MRPATFLSRLRRAARELVGPTVPAAPPRRVNECLRTAIRFACWNQVPGDYLEFGCHGGETFAYAFRTFEENRERVLRELDEKDAAAFRASAPRFFAFDSFEGLPAAADADAHPYQPKHWRRSGYATRPDAFRRSIAGQGVDLGRVELVEGWYDRTLVPETRRRHLLERASVVHIDCDYHESARLALDFVTDLVQDGTVLVFDDYNFYRGRNDLGERRAYGDWLDRNPHFCSTQLATHDFHSVAFFLGLE